MSRSSAPKNPIPPLLFLKNFYTSFKMYAAQGSPPPGSLSTGPKTRKGRWSFLWIDICLWSSHARTASNNLFTQLIPQLDYKEWRAGSVTFFSKYQWITQSQQLINEKSTHLHLFNLPQLATCSFFLESKVNTQFIFSINVKPISR